MLTMTKLGVNIESRSLQAFSFRGPSVRATRSSARTTRWDLRTLGNIGMSFAVPMFLWGTMQRGVDLGRQESLHQHWSHLNLMVPTRKHIMPYPPPRLPTRLDAQHVLVEQQSKGHSTITGFSYFRTMRPRTRERHEAPNRLIPSWQVYVQKQRLSQLGRVALVGECLG